MSIKTDNVVLDPEVQLFGDRTLILRGTHFFRGGEKSSAPPLIKAVITEFVAAILLNKTESLQIINQAQVPPQQISSTTACGWLSRADGSPSLQQARRTSTGKRKSMSQQISRLLKAESHANGNNVFSLLTDAPAAESHVRRRRTPLLPCNFFQG